jgi:hypothetical protein
MTRVPCEGIGMPDYPDGPNGQYVVRTMVWNQYAKALYVARMHGVGQVTNINFKTRQGGYHVGNPVQGWLAWFTPGRDLSGLGGVGLDITLSDGTKIVLDGYPLPDFSNWKDGDVYMVGP